MLNLELLDTLVILIAAGIGWVYLFQYESVLRKEKPTRTSWLRWIVMIAVIWGLPILPRELRQTLAPFIIFGCFFIPLVIFFRHWQSNKRPTQNSQPLLQFHRYYSLGFGLIGAYLALRHGWDLWNGAASPLGVSLLILGSFMAGIFFYRQSQGIRFTTTGIYHWPEVTTWDSIVTWEIVEKNKCALYMTIQQSNGRTTQMDFPFPNAYKEQIEQIMRRYAKHIQSQQATQTPP